jgi:peroxiredoxin
MCTHSRLIWSLFLLSLTLPSWAQRKGFVLIGKLPRVDSIKTVILTPFDGGEPQTVLIHHGQFVFTGQVKQPTLALVATDKVRSGVGVWLTNDTIRATFKVIKYGEGYQLIQPQTVSGPAESVDYLANIDSLNSYGKLGLSKLQRDQRRRDYIYQYVRAHPSSSYTAFFLRTNVSVLGVQLAKELFAGLSPIIQNSEDGKDIEKTIANQEATLLGKIVDPFVLPNLTGTNKALSTANRPFTLVYFWASWCVPCRYHNKELVKLYQQVDQNKLQIISVSLDTDKQAWLKAVEKDGLTWEQLSDLKGWDSPIVKQFAIYGVPQMILLDKDYKILALNIGEARRLITEK